MNQYDKKHYKFSRTSQDAFGYRLSRNDFEDKENSYYWAFIVIGLLMVVLYALWLDTWVRYGIKEVF